MYYFIYYIDYYTVIGNLSHLFLLPINMFYNYYVLGNKD